MGIEVLELIHRCHSEVFRRISMAVLTSNYFNLNLVLICT